jgi:hypothetical protein
MNDIVKRVLKKHQFCIFLLLMCVMMIGCGNDTDNSSSGNSIVSGGTGTGSTGTGSGGSNKKSYVRITNDGSSEIGFNVVVNGNAFYTREGDIITDVSNLTSEYVNEPFHRKLWRYIIKSKYHFEPYTGDAWGHSPILFLNSIGFGFCDDVSAVYHALATRFGYTARIWGLWAPGYVAGHVVPEVMIKDRWEMYDPDMEVYYWNKKTQVAGVEELSENPKLITNPVNPFPVSHFTPSIVTTDASKIPFAYTQLTADLYSNITARVDVTSYYQQIDIMKYDYPFNLPPKAYLEFPIKENVTLTTSSGIDVPIYNLMRLVLPKGWSGIVRLPFVFVAIKGSGSISLNDEVYDLDSPDIGNDLKIDSHIYQASINVSLTDIAIVFLVNKTRFDLDNISSVEIKSNDSKPLTVVYK